MKIEFEHLAPDFAWKPGAPGRPRNFYAPAPGADEVVVSIITSAYNPKPVFEETIAAVFGQSLQAWEWVIVDDASTESTAVAWLNSLPMVDKRIRILRQEKNQGLAAGRNAGLRAARGRYAFFLDDDDLIEPTTLEKLAWYLEVHPELAMAKGSTVAFGGQEYYATLNFTAGNLFLEQNHVTVMAMARRELLQQVGYFDAGLKYGLEDWELWIKLAAHGYWGGGIPEFLDWYRRRADHSDRWKSFSQSGIEAMRAELKRRYPELFRRGIPQPQPAPRAPYAPLPTELPWANRLAKDRPRWLFIIPWMAMGGADRFNLDFLRAWTERGYEMTVVTTVGRNYHWYREFARLTPDIFILPYLLPDHEWPRFLDYLIGSRQYDGVLISNSEAGYPLLPYLRARHPDVAFVDFNHMEEEYWQSGGHPRRAVAYQDVLDLNLVVSQHLKDWMIARGADGEQIDVVYINVDTGRFKPDAEMRAAVRARLKLAEDTPVLVYAGRICAQKQPQVFAAVMENLVKAKQRFVCLVLGDGEDMPWLRRYVEKHHLGGQVWLLGAVPNEAMREYLAAADVFFLPSQMEGISLAIYEAMASGLAVVGADVGGQAELVTPECGVLVKRGTFEEEVAAYTAALLALLRDPQRMRAMGAAGRARVEAHFPLPKMGEQMVAELLERAPTLHATRPKPVPGPRLALEIVQLGMEERRLTTTLGRLLKYERLEMYRWQWMRRWNTWRWRVQTSPVLLRLKPLKDTLWRAGHAVKDALWIVGHRIKVRLGLAKG